ncbi:hypothetical protein Tco_1145325 [Tanacetum coccineum]
MQISRMHPLTNIHQALMTRSQESAQERAVGLRGKPDFRNIAKKESMKKAFQTCRHELGGGGKKKIIQFMHTTMVPEQVKTMKIQAGIQCIDTSSASNAIFEINKLRKQLQGKEDTIRNLDAQRNTHSRTAYTEKLSALTAKNTKLKAQVTGKTSSGSSTSEKNKVLASGMYTNSSKTKAKPATEARKPKPKEPHLEPSYLAQKFAYKASAQSFDKSMSSSNAKLMEIRRRNIHQSFQIPTDMEHVRLKISVWQRQSERRSQSNSEK